MQSIRYYLLALIAGFSMMLPAVADAQTDNGTMGIKLGYNSIYEGTEFGLFFQYRAFDWVRISPEMSYVFRNQGYDAFRADVDCQFPLSIAKGDFSLYPLGGVNFSAWDRHLPGGKKAETYSRFGINFGAGFEYYCGSNIKIRVECKRTMTSDFSTWVSDFGIGYMF